MTWKTFFNPFSRYNEKALLLFGVFSFFIVTTLCYFFQMKMDGLLHFGSTENDTWWKIAVQNAFVFGSAFVVLWILAFFYNAKTRVIDVANTVLVSSVANVFVILFSGIPFFNKIPEKLSTVPPEKIMEHKTELMIVLLTSLFIIPFAIYSVVLLYNGFKIATNMKSWQKITLFFVVIFLLNLITQLYFPNLF